MDFDTLSSYPDQLTEKIQRYLAMRRKSKEECPQEFLTITQEALSNNKEWFISNLSHFVGEAERLNLIFNLRENKANSLMLELLNLLQKNVTDINTRQKGTELLLNLITFLKEQKKFLMSRWTTSIFYVIG
jgi:hypothetical protein